METELKAINDQLASELANIEDAGSLDATKARFLGPKGLLTARMKTLGKLPPEERPVAGKAINAAKQEAEKQIDLVRERLRHAADAKLLGESVDPSLPAPDPREGSLHPLTQTRRLVEDIFRRAGFTVADGPEIESEFYCFDALNMPPDHPSRDMQDTYYLPTEARVKGIAKHRDNENYLLRTHTSSVQVRTMLSQKPPLRIVAPGRCFRRDTPDATHSANFHQLEGLYIDRNVTVRDLQAILDYFVRDLLGPKAKTRLRPSFFPFTEPSFEVDFSAEHLDRVSGDWIEIMGCGMVDPAVFEAVGYDPEVWSGYAFGMGIERIAMILHGIDDIRYFYQNDVRFLRQFA